MHAQHQRGDKTEIEQAHEHALFRSHLVIPAFLVGFAAKKREQTGQRGDQNQQQNEIELGNGQEEQNRESHQPQPR